MAELVLIGGYPASGKSTTTQGYLDKGYKRLNRDLAGGKLEDLLPQLGKFLAAGESVVMDNLYATAAQRANPLGLAKGFGVPVHFVEMGTSMEDSQFNACIRMATQYGKILSSQELKKVINPNMFPVAVIYKYRKEYQKPSMAEGFDSIRTEKFVRTYPKEWTNKAAIFDFDGTLRTNVGNEKYPTKPSEVRAIKDRAAKLKKLQEDGYLLLGASNQSGVAKGTLTSDDVNACFDETLKQLGVKFEKVLHCPHSIPPVSCYCRKPGPGMGVELIVKYKLDPRQCFYVGDQTSDKTFAQRCGFKFFHEQDFWK